MEGRSGNFAVLLTITDGLKPFRKEELHIYNYINIIYNSCYIIYTTILT